MPAIVRREREAVAEVLAYLAEIDRRKLYLEESCSSLYAFCVERLHYSENGALKRVRAARLALRFPQVLEELRNGTLHLTALFLLANHLTNDNAGALIAECRGKTRKAIEHVLARWFPQPDVAAGIEPEPAFEQRELQPELVIRPPTTSVPAKRGEAVATSGAPVPGHVLSSPPGRIQPLSASRYRVQFTASAELRNKLEQALDLLSHVFPDRDLAALVERAIDLLLSAELKRRRGTGGARSGDESRKLRVLREGSRWVPREVADVVWERDGGQCAFVDAQGRRCSARRFITFEHRQPFSLGGPATVENVCLLCSGHNAHTARQVFGEVRTTRRRTATPQRREPPSSRGTCAPSSESTTAKNTTSESATSESATSEDTTFRSATSESATSEDTTADRAISEGATSEDTTSESAASEDTASGSATSEDTTADRANSEDATTTQSTCARLRAETLGDHASPRERETLQPAVLDANERVCLANERVCLANERVCLANERVCLANERVCLALRRLGFSKRDAEEAIAAVQRAEVHTEQDAGRLLRAAVQILTV